MMHSSPESLSERVLRREQYSRAVAGSWIEHGPQITRRRSDAPCTMEMASLRPRRMVWREGGVSGISEVRR